MENGKYRKNCKFNTTRRYRMRPSRLRLTHSECNPISYFSIRHTKPRVTNVTSGTPAPAHSARRPIFVFSWQRTRTEETHFAVSKIKYLPKSSTLQYTVWHPIMCDILLSIFDMFLRPVGWYCSYCAAQLVTGTSERKQHDDGMPQSVQYNNLAFDPPGRRINKKIHRVSYDHHHCGGGGI